MCKKIMKAPEDFLLEGDALVNGISIRYCKKGEDGKYYSIPGRSSAKITDEDEIYCTMDKKLICKETDKLMSRVTGISDKLKKIWKKITVIMFVLVLSSVLCGFEWGWKMAFCLCMFAVGLEKFSAVIAMFYLRIMKDEEMISLLRFHSAEHAVCNAYYDLKRMPEYTELRHYSNYSYTCGTLQFAPAFVLFSGFAIAQLLLPWPFNFCGFALVFLITFLSDREHKLYFLESLVLMRPTSKEYKVAIQALSAELTRFAMFEMDGMQESQVAEK